MNSSREPDLRYISQFRAFGDALYLTGSMGALRSEDGGISWQEMETPALVLSDISFVDSDTGYAISSDGVLRTDDAGSTWRRLAAAPEGAGRVEFTDVAHGVITTSNCVSGDCRLRIYRTDDAGRSWELAHTASPELASYVYDLEFVDLDHGWVATERGFLFTEDAGTTWQERMLNRPDSYVMGADLADVDDGWVIIAVADGANLLHSTDGGRTWAFVPGASTGGAPNTVDFVDAQHGWYSAQSCLDTCLESLFATTDGGQTWTLIQERLQLAYPHQFAFVDRLNGWLNESECDATGCRYHILHTADGGHTYTAQLSGELITGTFDFVDARNGWLLLDPNRGIGIGGGPAHRTLLYHTSDGGGGPIGREPILPDVGAYKPSSGGPWSLMIALAALGALAIGGGVAARRR